MRDSQVKFGMKVRVNAKHAGAKGAAGVVSSHKVHRWNGHSYHSVRLSGGWTMRFLASELDRR